MPLDSPLIAELQQLRQRIRDLERELIAEGNLAPGNELTRILLKPLFQESDVYLTLFDRGGRMLFLSHTDPSHSSDDLYGQSVFDFLKPEDHQAFRDALERVFQECCHVYVEAESVRGGRYGNHLAPLKLDGQVIAASNFSENVTQRRSVEQQLRESETRWRSLAESVPDSVVLLSLDGKFQYANRLRNLTLAQAQQMDYLEFVLPQYRAGVAAAFQQVLQTGKPVEIEVQDTIEQQWYLARLGPMWSEGKIVGVISIARNISGRKQREEQIRNDRDELERRVAERTEQLKAANRSLLKERRVLQRLLDLHDRDRQLVAYEIHDGMVQDMTGALMFFDTVGQSLRQKGGQTAANYEHALQLLRTSIQEARRLIDGLRPPVLEEYGLIDAIGNHVEELRHKYGIDAEFNHDVRFVRLSPVVERALYRIVQEALNNLALHSGSTRAHVSVHQLDAHVNIVVRDWGRGFDQATVQPKRFGLLSIRDRARLLGGEAEIESLLGVGTTIKVSLPVSDVLLPGEGLREEDLPPGLQ